MDPYGHHRRRYDADDYDQPSQPYPPPPPSSYFPDHPPPPFSSFPHHQPPPQPYPPYPSGVSYPPSEYPPPAQPIGVFHASHTRLDSDAYPPPHSTIPPAYAQHGFHRPDSGSPAGEEHHHYHPHMPGFHQSVSESPTGEEHHHYHPHMPGFIASHIHSHPAEPNSELSNKPSVRVYTKAETNYMFSIRDGKVILARADASDPTQHWVKDEKYSTKVKDEDGFPSFALVNKATGQALKHSVGATHPVQLIAYNSDVLDESILWTMGKDLGDGYRQIRMINNTRLVVDAYNGAKKHGGVHDGTIISLWQPGKGENQRWKITPY